MGVITYSQEITSVVAPSRMFKVLFLDSQNMLPKIVPKGIKSKKFVEGDGRVGSIKKTNFDGSSHIKSTKHKIEALDAGGFYSKYTTTESEIKHGKIHFVKKEVKSVEAGNGCIRKMTSTTSKKVVSSKKRISKRV